MFARGSAAVPWSTGCSADAGRIVEGLSEPDDGEYFVIRSRRDDEELDIWER